ncbi:response regulator [Segetibacter aerophilus]|uniref:Response regulator n=1 Tax=Segetibacter aerophilus TaxID=670293 RepID=A0A512BH58_9BACT|nr:response regulator [Segetibacter aerophilus]GEO11306.1 response regulator [Segetibacter aerophilus]
MRKYNVLIAEDDTDDYNFFVEGFEKISTSYCITRARNGLECITYLKTHNNPEIVFLDLNIPIKSGLECLKFIKDSNAFQHIPVVIYSTSHYIKHIDAAFKGGAHYYIVKPCNADLLVETLNIVLDRLEENLQTPGKAGFVVRNLVTLEH